MSGTRENWNSTFPLLFKTKMINHNGLKWWNFSSNRPIHRTVLWKNRRWSSSSKVIRTNRHSPRTHCRLEHFRVSLAVKPNSWHRSFIRSFWVAWTIKRPKFATQLQQRWLPTWSTIVTIHNCWTSTVIVSHVSFQYVSTDKRTRWRRLSSRRSRTV